MSIAYLEVTLVLPLDYRPILHIPVLPSFAGLSLFLLLAATFLLPLVLALISCVALVRFSFVPSLSAPPHPPLPPRLCPPPCSPLTRIPSCSPPLLLLPSSSSSRSCSPDAASMSMSPAFFLVRPPIPNGFRMNRAPFKACLPLPADPAPQLAEGRLRVAAAVLPPRRHPAVPARRLMKLHEPPGKKKSDSTLAVRGRLHVVRRPPPRTSTVVSWPSPIPSWASASSGR